MTSPIQEIERALKERRSCAIVGYPGSGKTWLLDKVAAGAIRVELAAGDPIDRVVTSILSQLSRVDKGQDALMALQQRNPSRSLEEVGGLLDGMPLIVDRAENLRLLGEESTRPSQALERERLHALREWLEAQRCRRPVLLVGRRTLTGWERIEYNAAPGAEILQEGHELLRPPWGPLRQVVSDNPGALRAIAALATLLGPASEESIQDTAEALSHAGKQYLAVEATRILAASIDDERRGALAVAAAIPGAPREVLEHALRAIDIPRGALRDLMDLELLTERDGGLWCLRTIEDCIEAFALPGARREDALRAAARAFRQRVGDPLRPTIETARYVFEAHRLYLEIGDFEEARKTAAFHIEGLVGLARKRSLAGHREEAASLYSRIRPLTPEGSHVCSYVIHYEHYNRYRAELQGPEDTIAGYVEARRQWPENALWWAREIELLLACGRERDMQTRLDEAYMHVPEHPERDSVLIGRPARKALDSGRPVMALELLERRLGVQSRQRPSQRLIWMAVLDAWAQGVDTTSLPLGHGSLRFLREVQAVLLEAGPRWQARLTTLDVAKNGASPLAALEHLARHLADEIVRLIRHRGDEDADSSRRRMHLLRYIDIINSDLPLEFPSERWLIGRIEDEWFVPVQDLLDRIRLPPEKQRPSHPEKLWMARIGAHRDGQPDGRLLELLETPLDRGFSSPFAPPGS